MDNDSETPESSRQFQIANLVRLLLSYRLVIAIFTLGPVVATIILTGIYYFSLQPRRWVASVEIRPTFTGAEAGIYPNGINFGPSDIVAVPVLDQVYENNQISDFCGREVFRAGFFVEQTSAELRFLDLEYQGKLADTRLTPGDRARLETEYRARRTSLPVRYKLTFIRPQACEKMTGDLVFKVLNDTLVIWANDAENRRGVLRMRAQILTPSVLTDALVPYESRLVRVDVIRTAINRVIANIASVESLAGAEVVRLGDSHVSFVEIRSRLEDLVKAEIEPLLSAGGAGGPDSLRWLQESLASARGRQRSAEDRANSFRTALREYSGTLAAPPAARAGQDERLAGDGSDVQTLSPQLDRTFLDRMIELSEPNTSFRQSLTRSMVDASVEAVAHNDNAAYYERLLGSIDRPPTGRAMTPAELDARMASIVAYATKQITAFNELYEELSRVGLRAAPALYSAEGPAYSVVEQSFTSRQYLALVGGVFLISLVAVIAAILLRVWLRTILEPQGPSPVA